MGTSFNIALVGNPNTGKSTIFNLLTGLNQKVSNFPGVTVEKRKGQFVGLDGKTCSIIDLPGTYSLYPKSADEHITLACLLDKKNLDYPNLILFIADITNLKRNLLLFSQVSDLNIPIVLVLNMMDEADKLGISIQINQLAKRLGVPVICLCARNDKRLLVLKKIISYCNTIPTQNIHYQLDELEQTMVSGIETNDIVPYTAESNLDSISSTSPYNHLLWVHHVDTLSFIPQRVKDNIKNKIKANAFQSNSQQVQETVKRYQIINRYLQETVSHPVNFAPKNTFDRIATHKIWGFVLFFAILYGMFQSIFSWSEYPSMLIENLFTYTTSLVREIIPNHFLTRLFVDGILSGLSGVLVFIPQIAFLFAFISILEDTGYMARVIFIMDRLMKKVGLNGKSVVPLIGGFACAVPSIMSARNIGNQKERLITIMVTPLVSCSARLPIYVLLIALAVPSKKYMGGVFNLQGATLMGLYVLSIVAAIVVAWITKQLLKSNEKSFLVMEMPTYKMPNWQNVGVAVYHKVKTFVFEAGKIIIGISIILWGLASYGPKQKFIEIDKKYETLTKQHSTTQTELNKLKNAEKLSASYAGILGKTIEPAIRPLGFDWKIGIALITSFAAREVFVGTMATLYSVDDDENSTSLKNKLNLAVNEQNKPVFSIATSFSLMIFYVFAMQCMSTLAIVYRETNKIKWPIIQFLYMGGLAYGCSLLVYQFLK